GFGGNRGGGHRIVARDHHRADAHPSQLGEALADAALDDVLELDHAEDIADKLDDSIDRALADPGGADLHAADAALRGEGNELALHFGDVAPAQAVLFLG